MCARLQGRCRSGHLLRFQEARHQEGAPALLGERCQLEVCTDAKVAFEQWCNVHGIGPVLAAKLIMLFLARSGEAHTGLFALDQVMSDVVHVAGACSYRLSAATD
jgi:hypothetical protein